MIHVLTPFWRKEYKDLLTLFLSREGVVWHPIIQEDIEFEGDWIQPLFVPFGPEVFDIMYHKLERFKQLVPVNPDEHYTFLCDDDLFEPGYYLKLAEAADAEVVVTSMKRPPKWYHTLTAAPQNMVCQAVGAEQLTLRGDVFLRESFPPDPRGWSDGLLAERLVRKYQVKYLPHLFVWHNYFKFKPRTWYGTVQSLEMGA